MPCVLSHRACFFVLKKFPCVLDIFLADKVVFRVVRDFFKTRVRVRAEHDTSFVFVSCVFQKTVTRLISNGRHESDYVRQAIRRL